MYIDFTENWDIKQMLYKNRFKNFDPNFNQHLNYM